MNGLLAALKRHRMRDGVSMINEAPFQLQCPVNSSSPKAKDGLHFNTESHFREAVIPKLSSKASEIVDFCGFFCCAEFVSASCFSIGLNIVGPIDLWGYLQCVSGDLVGI